MRPQASATADGMRRRDMIRPAFDQKSFTPAPWPILWKPLMSDDVGRGRRCGRQQSEAGPTKVSPKANLVAPRRLAGPSISRVCDWRNCRGRHFVGARFLQNETPEDAFAADRI